MTVLHTADLHMGKKAHGELHPDRLVNDRLVDVERVGMKISDIIRNQDVDLVLFAGDAFDHTTPSPTQQRMMLNVIKAWAEEAEVVMVPGNHDHPVSEGRNHACDIFREVPNVRVVETPQCIVRQGLAIAAFPWPLQRLASEGQSVYETYLSVAKDTLVKAAAESLVPVAVGHLTIQGSLPSGSEVSLAMSGEVTFPTSFFEGFAYTALGHIHTPQDLADQTNPNATPIVYPGSPERLTFSEEPNEPCVVLFDPKQPHEYQRERIATASTFYTLVAHVESADDFAGYNVPEDAIVRVQYSSDDRLNETEIIRHIEPKCRRVVEITWENPTDRTRRVATVDASQSPQELFTEWADRNEIAASDASLRDASELLEEIVQEL